jgi:hypothetical protein
MATFAFVPMNDRVVRKYARGLDNKYTEILRDFGDNEPGIDLPNHPLNPRYENAKLAKKYTQGMLTSPVSPTLSMGGGVLHQTIPLTTSIEGKPTTIGLRKMTGMRDYSTPYSLHSTDGFEMWGETVTHPKYKNYGAKGMIETMINHANNNPTQNHMIAGATSSLDRLYRIQRNKFPNIPSNLHFII